MKKSILSKKDILHLAKLSKLELSEKEVEKYLHQLEETIEYVNNLNELKTDSVIPTSQTTHLINVKFQDGAENKRKLNIGDVFKNAKTKKNNYFIVKRIL